MFVGGRGRKQVQIYKTKTEKGKHPWTKKGKGKMATSTICDPIPLGNQAARTHPRTERNDFAVEHPTTSESGYGTTQSGYGTTPI